MISTYLFTETGVVTGLEASPESLKDVDKKSLFWVDIRDYTDQDIHDLAATFDFHPVTVQSCIDAYRRPHLWEFEKYFYINFTTIKKSSSSTHSMKGSELHIFAGPQYLITASRDKVPEAVERALEQFRSAPAMCNRGPLYAVYILVEDLVETYFPYVEKLDSAADKLEDLMLENADKKTLAHLFTLKRKGQELRRLLGPQRDVFSELARREFSFVDGENRIYFQDSYNRIVRIFDMLDTVREVLSASLDVYLSSVSNRLNEVMKILTIVSTIMMVLGFITGFYGMNFTHLPWLEAPNAFRNLSIAMIIMVIGMLYAFRRKGWM